MTKPIFATKLVGIIISKEPYEKAHILWFEDIAKKLDRPDIKDWGTIYTQKDEYFAKVDEIMKLEYPNLSNEERTEKARNKFFEYVLKYIKQNPNVVNQEIIEKLKQIKEEHILALISTSEKEFLIKILEQLNLLDLFDIIEASNSNEKDDREQIYQKFVEKYGTPIKYIENLEDFK